MAKKYFTLTGTKHYYGSNFLKPGMKVQLEKEPDNEFDPEAILVKLNGLGKIGYVANSPYTIVGERTRQKEKLYWLQKEGFFASCVKRRKRSRSGWTIRIV